MTWPATRDGRHCLIIGEVAQAHDGSLGLAHAFIDSIADAGADAVKFQTHIAEFESSPAESWRIRFSQQDTSRYDYWKRMEFTEDAWVGLRDHARERGLYFLSSPFSIPAVELLERIGTDAWKVASGETNNRTLLERMAATGLPIILSTGMSYIKEIDWAVSLLKSSSCPLTVLQCTSVYPCPPELVGTNMLSEFRARYECNVGLSDHSGTIYPSIAAAGMSADVVEVHVTLSREMFGPDVKSSVTTTELRQLVDGIRFIETALSHPIDKDAVTDSLRPMREAFTKSIVTAIDLEAGTLLTRNHLSSRKPGTGIPVNDIDEVVGKRLRRAVSANQFLAPEDIEK